MSIAHWLRFALLLCFAGCSGSISPHATVGEFSVMGVNVPEGGVWQINRPIRLEFNHALDPSSVSFSSVLFLPVSPELGGNPVTGTFMIEAGSAGRVLKFQPYCPQEADWSDAGLVPGGYFYRLELPTSSTHAGTVLRDTDGRQLSNGISRNFRTPDPPTESIFLDENPLPPSVTSVSWPAGLNFFSRPDGPVSIAFDQSIDPSPANLNGDRITVHYSEETIASGLLPTFAHPVPGSFVMAANCTGVGALVEFHPHGLLPPDRWLRLTVSNSFRDISGQENFETWNSSLHATPTLEEFYGDQRLGYDSSNETWDEINEGFLDSGVLDPHAAIPGPPAGTVGGSLVATFDYPGQYVSEEMDFYWVDQGEIRTNGRTTISDSLNRVFVVDNGVLHVDDFHLGVDSFLRGVGTNPLIIYAQGTVTIDGELDASGQHSIHPTGLNSPQFPEGPMLGQCGGGDGGMSSQLTATETPRAGSGRGAFDTPVGGGQGGEGGFQQEQGVGGLGSSIPRLLAAGGGGGTFAMTPNYALWHKGWEFELSPEGADNNGPDHIQEKNPYWPDGVFRDHLVTTEFDLPIFGGEDGMRGSSVDAFAGYDPFNPPSTPHGTYGMEDERVDVVDPIDDLNNFDPRWDTPLSPVAVGHPTEGPDEGRGGLPVFTQDLDSSDDFWGRRLNQDGSVTTGELLAPWAGSGGGGSGDSQLVLRSIDPATGQYYPLIEEFPVRPFPPSSGTYRKGAPGGGGGGQILIMAIGPIRLGADSLLRVNGGIGRGGEGTIGTTGQISGAGGGSGG
ncbi:MAG: hypothetical protein MK213_06065, partial [Planctomycetes bacterium]|nr:hypothetical protein [Planctomycetota bacterium]